MLFVNKLKVLTLMTCLVLVGQGFAQVSSQYSAPGSSQSSAPESSSSSKMDLWSDYTSEPKSESINDTTYYRITSAEELAWFAARMNETTKSNPNVNTSESAILLADIDLSGKLWVPIAAGKGDGVFMGTFDGNGHKITGLTIDGHRIAYGTTNVYCRDKENKPLCNGQNIGFFGALKGTVKNLSLEVADIQASNSEGLTMQMGKPISVGTLVGWMSAGTIDGVYVSGRINTSGNGQGVGGIVGNAASGTVENSVSDVSIYASGDKVFIGGILGYTKGEVNVHSCMYTGESIINDGKNGSIGGIVGNSTSNKLNATNSFFDTDVAGNKGVGTGSVTNENKPTGVKELNTEQVACGMNGKTWDANLQVCSGEGSDEWEVGISELSQNGSDGYKITFVVNAEGAAFPDEAVTTKLVAKNAPITADGISLPTREGYKFAGWAETDDAEDPSDNLGTATGRRTIYAVWYGKFPVTFNAGTGSFPHGTPDPLMVAKKDLISLDIEVPVKASIGEDHFYFAGWTTGTTSEVIFDKNQDVTGLVDFDVFTVSAAAVFYPAWTKEIVHTVKFNANGHGQTKLEQVDISDGLVLNAPDNPSPYKGYQYDAWCITQDCQNSSDVFTFPQTINSSFELFAKWSAVPYTINYNLDGGSVPNPGNPSTYTIEDQFVLKDPSKTCYDFIGWYDLNGNHVEGITKGTTEEKTFSARWTQQTKAINYSTGNIIQATATSQEFLCGESIALSDTIGAFSRPGYTQDGWTTTIGGNNVMAPEASYTGTETVTLYAHWSLNSYDIIYETNGGEFATSAISSYTTEDAVVLAEPTRDGYEFDGWYTNADFNGNKVSSIAAGSTGDTTFFAKWTPVEYTITYENVNGATNDNATSYTIEQSVVLNNLEKDGFVFAGWYDNAQFEGDAAIEIPQGTTGEKTFYAKWLEVFTITYAPGDDEGVTGEVASGTKIEGETATLSNDGFARDGYTQTGWKTADASATFDMGGSYTADASVTLYPVWNVETYNIVYHNIEGATFETANPTTYTVEDGKIELNSPSKSGYNFLGWSLTENSTEYVDGIAAGSTGEANFYANWEKVYPFLVNDFGAIKVYENSDGSKTAQINTNSSETVEIPSDISVNHVEFVRKFTVGKNSTIMLPFSIDTTKISGGSFKEFAYVDESVPKAVFYNDVAGGVVQANTPYIFVPTSDTLIFNLEEGETVSLNTNDIVVPVSNTDGGKWQFRGVYSREEWESGDRQVWGYVSNTSSEVAKIGKFLRAGAGAYIDPMRGYLYNTQAEEQTSTPQASRRLLAKSANLSTQTASISNGSGFNSIEVDFIEREVEADVETETVPEVEETTVISKVNPISGGIKAVNGWFDMRGRKLNAKPTTKGIYYFNGKQVIVR
jgi:uncharacterized repeat protein (TIGR02543 family)